MSAEQAKAESAQRGLEEERRALMQRLSMEREELERAKVGGAYVGDVGFQGVGPGAHVLHRAPECCRSQPLIRFAAVCMFFRAPCWRNSRP